MPTCTSNDPDAGGRAPLGDQIPPAALGVGRVVDADLAAAAEKLQHVIERSHREGRALPVRLDVARIEVVRGMPRAGAGAAVIPDVDDAGPVSEP